VGSSRCSVSLIEIILTVASPAERSIQSQLMAQVALSLQRLGLLARTAFGRVSLPVNGAGRNGGFRPLLMTSASEHT
jgi:hypothetical protein